MSTDIKFDEKGKIEKIIFDNFTIPFTGEKQGFYYRDEAKNITDIGIDYTGTKTDCNGYGFCAKAEAKEGFVRISYSVSSATAAADIIGIRTGIDTYMDAYPQWNSKFFPTMIRCEKTHTWGYMISPTGKCFAFAVTEPIASYTYDYNMLDELNFGHRIYTVNLQFVNQNKLPPRHIQNSVNLVSGGGFTWNLYIIPLKNPSEAGRKINEICHLPIIDVEQTSLSAGDKIKYTAYCDNIKSYTVTNPNGEECTDFIARIAGLYTIRIEDKSGKVSEAVLHCHREYEWYMKKAREAAAKYAQKASTHTESWYGFYSAFLAAKHYPDESIDSVLSAQFDEMAPLMFDYENAEPITIPWRVQNTSSFIGVLCDRYESDREKYKNDIYLASRFGDWLMSTQGADGAYYRDGRQHYTCVIYLAKSMLELAEAEKEVLPEKSRQHYESAKRAVENLVELLERIGTEGEHTLEDGMLSCSALQIGMFALTLDETERYKYIKAAKHMLCVHECLEQNIIPDTRMRGATLRFWEAQYDVQIKANMMNSPHGWSAWYAYALYYLYILTGERHYLIKLINTLGSCLQLMSDDGKLRWAFVSEPYVEAKIFVPDTTKPVNDGYKTVQLKNTAYRGKYIEATLGEEYVDMISDWYRTNEQRLTGGYNFCPLILKDGSYEVDVQGGCCDNDVHEIFKCLEETLLKKVFIIENGEKIEGYNCSVRLDSGVIYIESKEKTDYIHINIKEPADIVFDGKNIAKNISGMQMIKIN